MRIHLKWFGGMYPRQGEQHLKKDRLAQTGFFPTGSQPKSPDFERGSPATEAENTHLYSGELRPLHEPALVHTFCQPGDDCWREPGDPYEPPNLPPPNKCVPVVITEQPEGFYPVSVGETITLSVTVNEDASAPVFYQWLKDGAAIPGAVDSVFTETMLETSGDITTYQVYVSNSCGEQLSIRVPIYKNPPPEDQTPEELILGGENWQGYGWRHMVAASPDGKKIVFNQAGKSKAAVSDDGGETWDDVVFWADNYGYPINGLGYDKVSGRFWADSYRTEQRECRFYYTTDSDLSMTAWGQLGESNGYAGYNYHHGFVIAHTAGNVSQLYFGNHDSLASGGGDRRVTFFKLNSTDAPGQETPLSTTDYIQCNLGGGSPGGDVNQSAWGMVVMDRWVFTCHYLQGEEPQQVRVQDIAFGTEGPVPDPSFPQPQDGRIVGYPPANNGKEYDTDGKYMIWATSGIPGGAPVSAAYLYVYTPLYFINDVQTVDFGTQIVPDSARICKGSHPDKMYISAHDYNDPKRLLITTATIIKTGVDGDDEDTITMEQGPVQAIVSETDANFGENASNRDARQLYHLRVNDWLYGWVDDVNGDDKSRLIKFTLAI